MRADQRELCLVAGRREHRRHRRRKALRRVLGGRQPAIEARLGDPGRMLVDAAEARHEIARAPCRAAAGRSGCFAAAASYLLPSLIRRPLPAPRALGHIGGMSYSDDSHPCPLRSARMGRLTTHVLDTALGKPAAGLADQPAPGRQAWRGARERRHQCGRPLRPAAAAKATTMEAGSYELIFEAGAYFDRLGLDAARAEIPGPGGDPLRHRRPGRRTTTCRCCSRPSAIPPTGAADGGGDPLPARRRGAHARAASRRR